MNPIKLILVDDDHETTKTVKQLLKELPDFQLIGQCQTGEQLVEAVIIKRPDLILTAIQLAGKSGLQAIKDCKMLFPDIKVIFITGFDEFAVEAFELAAIDYIVKPVERERFVMALERAKTIIWFEQQKKETSAPLQKAKVLPLRDQHGILFIPLADIYFIEKSGKKCLVYTKQDIYETNETMASLLTHLDHSFFQTHRSYIINLKKISQITPQKESFIVQFLNYEHRAKISKLKMNEVRARISM